MWDRVTQFAAPGATAITTDEAKAWLDLEYDDDNSLIDTLIASAISKMDGPRGIGIACVTQTWELSLDCFPPFLIELPGWPVKSITSVTYIDGTGASQTIPSSEYVLDLGGDAARLSPVFGGSWPSTRAQAGSVKIQYVLGEEVGSVSPILKLALKQMVGHWYENREAVSEQTLMEIPMGAMQIISDYRRGGIAA